MLNFPQIVVLAGGLLWGSRLALAQTIVVDSETLEANASTVAPAGQTVNGVTVLTEDVLANLTALSLTNVSLFGFATNDSSLVRASTECKTFPGDPEWPRTSLWSLFNLLTGFAVIKDTPLASVCYGSWANFDAEACAHVTAEWSNVSLHIPSPSDLMFPLWQGTTCLPPNVTTNQPTGNCTVGGFPSYIVNATTVAQIQLAVNFARSLNLRLVVKNTGHDFNGRSAGAGALSVWTNSFKDIKFYKTFKTPSYKGPAMRIGAAVQNRELFAAADSFGVTAVGGLCTTVGAGGGYFAGGGHSPMTSLLGLGADQVLSVDVVTPDGRFVTADENHNKELFWALRGGGGSSWGVTTSWTIKVTPKLSSASVLKFSLTSGAGFTTETLWQAIRAYFLSVPTYNAAGNYGYFQILPAGDELSFGISAWFAPNMTLSEHQALVAPLFNTWSDLGIKVNATWGQYNSYLAAWEQLIDAEVVGAVTSRSANRLIPKENLLNETLFNQTFAAIQELHRLGVIVVGYGMSAAPADYPDNSVNPAWRNNALYLISAIAWSENLTWPEVSAISLNYTNNWLQPMRDLTPGAGAYHSEGDVLEPDWQESFYGKTTYERLYSLKQKLDPTGVFYAHRAVGSESWYVTNQLEGLPTQNGRLCRR